MVSHQRLSPGNRRTVHVAVVDPKPTDYAALLDAFPEGGVGFHFLPCGRDALRMAQALGADMWVINVGLPDISGLDLCAMVNDRWPQSVVYVIADEFRAADERAARACGASFFTCKPVQAECFEPDRLLHRGSAAAAWR